MKLVKEVMINDVICVSPFAKLREALSLMKKHNVKSLVVEKQHPNDAYGLITYTNVLKTVILNVYDACAKPAIAVGKSLAVRQVAALMTEHRVKRILVLEDNDLLGFVTMDDIMAVLLEQVD